MSQNHHYEIAEFGEPLDLEEQLIRIRVFPHGKRCKLRLERLNLPIAVTRPNLLDNSGELPQDTQQTT